MRIRPTELGWKGIVLLAALGIAFFAAAYSNPFFLILVFCGTLGVLGAAWTARNLRGIDLEVQTSALLPAGAAGELDVGIVVPAGRTAFALEVRIELTDRACVEAGIAMARGRTVLRLALPPLPRGVHVVRELQLVTRHPFGLFAARRRVAVACELAVHPRLLDAEAMRGGGGRGGDSDDDLAAQRGRRGSSLRTLRPFRPGDAPSDVHWKATARRGEPIVKEREPEGAGIAATVVVDLRRTGEALEDALARGATALARAVEKGRQVRFAAQGCACTVRDRQGLHRVLRFLAAAAPLPADAPPPRPEGARA